VIVPGALWASDDDNSESGFVGSSGKPSAAGEFTLALDEYDYETVMAALALVAMNGDLNLGQRLRMSALGTALNDWNHCDEWTERCG
jgi:hypothetical protein